jgi:hypothetical protein
MDNLNLVCSTHVSLRSITNISTIANAEGCSPTDILKPLSDTKDIIALGRILVTLMEKFCPPSGKPGLERPDKWEKDAVDFIACTASETPQDLVKVSTATTV